MRTVGRRPVLGLTWGKLAHLTKRGTFDTTYWLRIYTINQSQNYARTLKSAVAFMNLFHYIEKMFPLIKKPQWPLDLSCLKLRQF